MGNFSETTHLPSVTMAFTPKEGCNEVAEWKDFMGEKRCRYIKYLLVERDQHVELDPYWRNPNFSNIFVPVLIKCAVGTSAPTILAGMWQIISWVMAPPLQMAFCSESDIKWFRVGVYCAVRELLCFKRQKLLLQLLSYTDTVTWLLWRKLAVEHLPAGCWG